MITRSIWPALAACTPLEPVSAALGLELLVQRKLLDQRVAQLRVVVDDQNFAGIRHSEALGGSRGTGGVARNRAFGRKRASGS